MVIMMARLSQRSQGYKLEEVCKLIYRVTDLTLNIFKISAKDSMYMNNAEKSSHCMNSRKMILLPFHTYSLGE